MLRKSEAGTWVPASQPVSQSEAAANLVEGERRLMTAVLVHALRSLFHDAERPGRGAARRLRQDLRWLTSPERDDLFSFERICELLELNSHRVRQHVLARLGTTTQLLGADDAAARRLAAEPLFGQPGPGWDAQAPTGS